MAKWLGQVGVKTLYIPPGLPCENGYNESLNGSLREEPCGRQDLLQPRRGEGADRGAAAPLQHRRTAQQLEQSLACTRSFISAIAGLRFRFAPPAPGNGSGDKNGLPNHPDGLVGAAQEASSKDRGYAALSSAAGRRQIEGGSA